MSCEAVVPGPVSPRKGGPDGPPCRCTGAAPGPPGHPRTGRRQGRRGRRRPGTPSLHRPPPLPSTNRPPLISSIVAACLATRPGSRYRLARTHDPTGTRDVEAATRASSATASQRPSTGSSGARRARRPSGIHTVSNPVASAQTARSRTSRQKSGTGSACERHELRATPISKPATSLPPCSVVAGSTGGKAARTRGGALGRPPSAYAPPAPRAANGRRSRGIDFVWSATVG